MACKGWGQENPHGYTQRPPQRDSAYPGRLLSRRPPPQQPYLGHQLVESCQEVQGGYGLLGAAHSRDARRRQELLPQGEGGVQAFGES